MCSSDNPNSLSSPSVRMGRNDIARQQVYGFTMPRKATPARSIGPDWFLVEWMASKKMSQAELGRRCGWSKATANDIYHGKTEYYRAILNQVASALEIHPWELLMPPAEAHRIKRWRAAFEAEALLRAAEETAEYNSAAQQPNRLLPRKAS